MSWHPAEGLPMPKKRARRRTSEEVRESEEKKWQRMVCLVNGVVDGSKYIACAWTLDSMDTDDRWEIARVKRSFRKLMGSMGYVRMDNPGATDGRWKIYGESVVLYREGNAPPLSTPAEVKRAMFGA